MKRFLPLITIVLFGCANQTPQQKLTTAQQIVGVAIDGYVATNGGKSVTPAQLKAISDQLFGIATQAQGSVGQTPAAANVAQGSAIAQIGQNVQAALPNSPLTQAQVNNLFAAATLAK